MAIQLYNILHCPVSEYSVLVPEQLISINHIIKDALISEVIQKLFSKSISHS